MATLRTEDEEYVREEDPLESPSGYRCIDYGETYHRYGGEYSLSSLMFNLEYYDDFISLEEYYE